MTCRVFLKLFQCSTQSQFASGSPVITESCHLGSMTQQIDIYGDEVYMGKNDKLSQGIRVSITCLDLVIFMFCIYLSYFTIHKKKICSPTSHIALHFVFNTDIACATHYFDIVLHTYLIHLSQPCLTLHVLT